MNMSDTGAISIPASAVVKNVETANLTGAGTVDGDFSGWTGLTTLKISEVGGTAGQAITAAATTNVTLADSNLAANTISVQGGNAVTLTAAKATGSTAVKEVFTATFSGTTDNDTVTFDGTGALALGAGKTATQAAAAYVAAYNAVGGATWVAVDNLDGTVTFTSKTVGARTDITTANFVVGSGGGGADATVTAAAPTTQGTTSVGGVINVGTTTAVTGAVNVTSTVLSTQTTATANTINVTGGTTVNVTANLAGAVNNTITGGAIAVTGGSATTAVTVTQTKAATAAATVSGVVDGGVTVNDASNASGTAAGTITTVTLNNFGASTIDSSALTTVNLSGSGVTLGIGRGALTATPTANTLALNVDSLTTTGAITDSEAGADDGFTTLNITTAGTKSTIASLVAADATALNVAGTAALDLTAVTLGALKTVTISGGAGLSADVSGVGAQLTSVTSTSTGNNTLTVANTVTTLTTAGGTDAVTLTGAIGATAKIDLGAGNDSLKLSTGASTKGASITGGDGTDTLIVGDGTWIDGVVTYTSFEKADLTGIAASTLDMANLASATELVATGAFVGAANVTNIAAGTTVTLTAAGTNYATGAKLTYDLKTDTAADALTVTLANTDSATKAVAGKGDDSIGGNITVTELDASDIESLTIDSTVANVDGGAGATAGTHVASEYKHVVTMLTGDTDLTTLTLKGNASLEITDVTTNVLTKVDASAMTGKLTINLDSSANLGAVAVLGGSNVDTITMTGNTAANNIIVGNGGADVIVLAASGTKETVRFAADTDSVLTLTDTTVPAVTPVVYDTATGYDSITNFITGQDKIELSSALGLATGDARSAIAGKGTIGDNSVTNAELAAALQTLIGTGTGFFNDGAANRAVAQVIIDDATDAAMIFIDVNADGNFTNGTDGAIYLVGATTGIVITDIVFG